MTIKEAHTEAGFTQAEISRLLGIPIKTLSQWAGGLRKPSPWVEKLVIAEIKRLKAVVEDGEE